jgi:misacylated tRNA(Ala) deacylase
MTELLYQTDSYLREFEANVVTVNEEGAVALDRTAFYPGGGGQPCDYGGAALRRERLARRPGQARGDHVWHWLGASRRKWARA